MFIFIFMKNKNTKLLLSMKILKQQTFSNNLVFYLNT